MRPATGRDDRATGGLRMHILLLRSSQVARARLEAVLTRERHQPGDELDHGDHGDELDHRLGDHGQRCNTEGTGQCQGEWKDDQRVTGRRREDDRAGAPNVQARHPACHQSDRDRKKGEDGVEGDQADQFKGTRTGGGDLRPDHDCERGHHQRHHGCRHGGRDRSADAVAASKDLDHAGRGKRGNDEDEERLDEGSWLDHREYLGPGEDQQVQG